MRPTNDRHHHDYGTTDCSSPVVGDAHMTQAVIQMHESVDESGVRYQHFTINVADAPSAAVGLETAKTLMDGLRGDRKAFLRRKPQGIRDWDHEKAAFDCRGYARFSICPDIEGDWETMLPPPPSEGLGDFLEAMKA
jgi:hypothetical protein